MPFSGSKLPQTFVVLYGLTGTGKTEIIRQLEEKGWPVLDLEGLANHRVLFWQHRLGQQPSQKRLESLIFAKLKVSGRKGNCDRRGEQAHRQAFVPEVICRGMKVGKRVLIYAP